MDLEGYGDSRTMAATQQISTGSGPMITKTAAKTPETDLRLQLQWTRMSKRSMHLYLNMKAPASPISLITTIPLIMRIMDPPDCCEWTAGHWLSC